MSEIEGHIITLALSSLPRMKDKRDVKVKNPSALWLIYRIILSRDLPHVGQ